MKSQKFMNWFLIVLMLAFATTLFAEFPIPEVTPDVPEEEMTAFKFATPPTIDGDLTDWIEAGAIFKLVGTDDHILRGFDMWFGPEDRSIVWSVMWDDDYFYYASARWDDFLTLSSDSTNGWTGDCTFLFFDTDLDGESDVHAQTLYYPAEEIPKLMSMKNAVIADHRTGWPGSMIAMPLDERLGEAGLFTECALPIKDFENLVFAVGEGFPLNIGEEEGNQEPDGGKFLAWKVEAPINVDMYWVSLGDVATSVSQAADYIPSQFELAQNYPNPFNPSTTIQYSLSQKAMVQLAVYNQNGQLVDMLVAQEMSAGPHEVTWNAAHVPSGLYFYTMTTEKSKQTRKMLLIK